MSIKEHGLARYRAQIEQNVAQARVSRRARGGRAGARAASRPFRSTSSASGTYRAHGRRGAECVERGDRRAASGARYRGAVGHGARRAVLHSRGEYQPSQPASPISICSPTRSSRSATSCAPRRRDERREESRAGCARSRRRAEWCTTPVTGAVALPIHMSTTYERGPNGELVSEFMYGRYDNPTRQALEKCLAELEGGADAAAFASGLAATMAVFQSLASGDHVVAPSDGYHGTLDQLRTIFGEWGLTSTFVDMTRSRCGDRGVQLAHASSSGSRRRPIRSCASPTSRA